jgi:hypothetical protein
MKKILLTKTLFTLVVLSIIVLPSSCTENYPNGEDHFVTEVEVLDRESSRQCVWKRERRSSHSGITPV